MYPNGAWVLWSSYNVDSQFSWSGLKEVEAAILSGDFLKVDEIVCVDVLGRVWHELLGHLIDFLDVYFASMVEVSLLVHQVLREVYLAQNFFDFSFALATCTYANIDCGDVAYPQSVGIIVSFEQPLFLRDPLFGSFKIRTEPIANMVGIHVFEGFFLALD